MLGRKRKRQGRPGSGRQLRVEGLETRWMLAADWSGFMVSDLNGNLLAVDVEDTGDVGQAHAELLATTTIPLFDIAVSPTGHVYGIGDASGGSSILYEFDVDYENPGGLISPNAVDGIVADGGSVWMNGLEFTPDGVLLGTGYDFWGNNYLYSLNTDTAVGNELLYLDNHCPAGDIAIDEDGSVFTVTFVGNLISIADDYSGYTLVGNVGAPDVYGMTYGPGSDLRGYRSDGSILNIDPTDATWVGEGVIWSSTVPTLSTLLGASTIYDPPTDLGEVDFLELTGQSAILDTLWYRLDTAHDGYLTVELDDLSSTTNLEMVLHRQNAEGELEEIDTGTTRVDHDAAVAGDRYFVEITGLVSDATVRVGNQVDPTSDSLTIHGSDIDDVLELILGSTYQIDINGLDYEVSFPGATLVTTTFDGEIGNDVARIVGDDGDDVATFDLATRTGTIEAPGYRVELASTTVMEFDGGDGVDTVGIAGTDADSQLDLAPAHALITEPGVIVTIDAEVITIDAAGGNDPVVFVGDTKADQANLFPDSGIFQEVVPEGEVRDPVYIITTTNIESSDVTAGGGSGRDVAYLRDSAGDETFTVGFGTAEYAGPGYSHDLHGFIQVHAYGLNGGHDTATIFDTFDDDKFKGGPTQTVLRGGAFYFRAKAFEDVQVTSLYGGDDYAVFNDTANADIFTASYLTAQMTNGTLTYRAAGFDRVLARSTAGYDIAYLQDSPGDDTMRGRAHKTTFLGPDFDLTVRAFDEVHAESVFGGSDFAKMHDTPGDDHLTATGDNAQMYRLNGATLDLLYGVIGFDPVKAYWSTGTNTKDITLPIDFTYLEEWV